MKLRTVMSAVVALTLAATALGQEKLKVGDSAPGLDIEKWVKGEETTIEEGKVYVVEFWATWCAPCRKSIPHLTELQERYSDEGLTIIGVSDEEVDLVEKFVRAQKDKMDYTVAVDRRESTKRAWFSAAGLDGIPAAFVVDQKGKIAFIGHPLSEEFEDALGKVLSGRYDAKLAKAAAPALAAAEQNRKVRNWRQADKHYSDVIALDAQIFATTVLEQFEMKLVDMDDKEAAYDFARNKVQNELFAADAEALQWLAKKIATDPGIPQDKRDLDVALELAETARRVAGPHDAQSLGVLALVHYQRGEYDQAVQLQKQAYFAATPKRKADFKRTLDQYQQASQRVSSLSPK